MKLKRILALALAMQLLTAMMPVPDMTAFASYSMPYYIEVDLTNQIVTIFSTDTKVIVRQMLCSTGLKDATPKGTYVLPRKEERLEREKWYYFRSFNCYAHYATRIYMNVLFHSIPCSRKSDSSISKEALNAFGHPASHGCIRLRWQDAEFIAKCCLEGTKVRIYESKKKNKDLRELLYANSYTNEKGQSYETFLGIPQEEGVLGRYSEGKEVVSLQTRLRDLGFYDGDIDGVYRGSTINAVREAQRQMGMDETGMADADFQQAIMDDDQAPTAMNVAVQEGMSGPVVRSMQQYLQDLQLYDGAIDGVYDVDVGEAVRKFQGAYGYPTDGVLMPVTQKALYYEAGKVKAMFSQNEGYTLEETAGQIYLARMNSDISIRLRRKPSGASDTLERLSNGDMMVVLDRSEEWNKVRRGRNVGYIHDRYVKIYGLDIYQLKYTATDDGLTYTIGSTDKGYYDGANIPLEVFEDYLAADGSLDDYEGISTYAKVNTASDDISLNLREKPNTSSAILAELPNATEVKVLLQSTEWSLVDWEGRNGYLLNQYLEFWDGPDEEMTEEGEQDIPDEDADNTRLSAMVVAMSGDRAAVYDVDSDDGTVLGTLKNGIRLEVVESVGGWSKISYQDHIGYMKDEDLQFMVTDGLTT